jgi:hypothetical protein
VVASAACHPSDLPALGEVACLPTTGHLDLHCLMLPELPKEVVEDLRFDHLQNLVTLVTFSSNRTDDAYRVHKDVDVLIERQM